MCAHHRSAYKTNHHPCQIKNAVRPRRAARLVLRCVRVARPVGPVGIDVERPRGTRDNLFRDHDLLDAFEVLDTMFDLPSLEGVEEVVISKEVVEGTARPLYIYADRTDRAGDANAS